MGHDRGGGRAGNNRFAHYRAQEESGGVTKFKKIAQTKGIFGSLFCFYRVCPGLTRELAPTKINPIPCIISRINHEEALQLLPRLSEREVRVQGQ